MSTIHSINVSSQTGTTKQSVATAAFNLRGIEGDAHSGAWHRQISLLSIEHIRHFAESAKVEFKPGDFAENLTTEGIDFAELAMFDHLRIGEVELEVTQFGKKCHGGACAIFREIGKCVMPKEGIFCRVVQPGRIRVGDRLEVIPSKLPVHIITLSDRASRGEYEDLGGPQVKKRVEEYFTGKKWRFAIDNSLIPDDGEQLRALIRQNVEAGCRILITTGGTGIGPRDITPDVVRPLLDKEIPGIMEYVRCKYGASVPGALISRSIAGVIGNTLVYTLPGSVKAVNEYLAEILPTVDHSLRMLAAIDEH